MFEWIYFKRVMGSELEFVGLDPEYSVMGEMSNIYDLFTVTFA